MTGGGDALLVHMGVEGRVRSRTNGLKKRMILERDVARGAFDSWPQLDEKMPGLVIVKADTSLPLKPSMMQRGLLKLVAIGFPRVWEMNLTLRLADRARGRKGRQGRQGRAAGIASPIWLMRTQYIWKSNTAQPSDA